MTRLLLLIATVGIALVAYGAFANDYAIAAFALIAAIASAAYVATANTRKQRLADVYEDLSPAERSMLRPLRMAHEQLEALATTSASDSVRVVAREALGEADHIIAQAVKMVSTRTQIARALAGDVSASREAGELRTEIERAGEDEKAKLTAALDARERESTHYAALRKALDQIDSTLKEAEASLAEMRAKLAVAAALPGDSGEAAPDLSESMNNLRSLSVSFDEAEQVLGSGP